MSKRLPLHTDRRPMGPQRDVEPPRLASLILGALFVFAFVVVVFVCLTVNGSVVQR